MQVTGNYQEQNSEWNPTENGLVERMNHTLLERVRYVLLNVGLPKSFWGKALMTACYLINHCPSSVITFKTPIEMWSGQPANYFNLRFFFLHGIHMY